MTETIEPVFVNTEQSRDAALMHRISNGDEAALGLLYDCYRTILFGLLIRILHNRAEAENILQEVFVQVWQEARNFEAGNGKVFARLVTIARSKAFDRLSSLKTQTGAALESQASKPICTCLKTEPNPIVKKRQLLIRTALSQLPENQSSLLLMAFFEGCSQREIAERTDTSLKMVKTRMRAGMTKLRETLSTLN